MEFTIPGAVAWAAREFGDAEALAEPGGPRLSYRELNERVTAVSGALIDAGVKPGDRVALWAPNGWHWTLAALGTLGAGGTLVPVSTRFTGPEALDVIDRSGARALFVAGDFLGVDRLPGAPTIYQMILDHPQRAGRDLSSRRLAVTGAADVPVALVERMRRELSFETVLTAYGLTEAVVATMCRPGDPPEVVSATSGRAAAGFEVKMGRSDEIMLRGPNLMLGYLDDPEATRAAIGRDGWLHTGDAGRLDADGYLTITGRLKDMYICGGFNVYPAEVEQVLARLDGVAESAVIGVAEPRLGQVGQAFVVARPGFVLAEADVLAFCRERLANYKVPRRVEFRDTLPRNPSGKVLKRQLIAELRVQGKEP